MAPDGTDHALVPLDGGGALATLPDLVDKARTYAGASRSAATLRAYAIDWRHWAAWCARRGLPALPSEPRVIALYLTDHAGKLSIATLGRRLVAINRAHRLRGEHVDLRHPIVRETWAGIRRTHGTAPAKKAALTVADLRAALAALACPARAPAATRLRLTRDRALLLVGFASAMRRSELAALEIGDLAFTGEGVRLTIRRSKTDQEAAGAEIGIPVGNGETCPVAALREWIEAAGIAEGPVFRPVARSGAVPAEPMSGHAIAATVKRCVARVGLDPAAFAGHSLRSGFATSAAAAGAQLPEIMAQTRHRSMAVALGYVQRGAVLRNKAVRALGL